MDRLPIIEDCKNNIRSRWSQKPQFKDTLGCKDKTLLLSVSIVGKSRADFDYLYVSVANIFHQETLRVLTKSSWKKRILKHAKAGQAQTESAFNIKPKGSKKNAYCSCAVKDGLSSKAPPYFSILFSFGTSLRVIRTFSLGTWRASTMASVTFLINSSFFSGVLPSRILIWTIGTLVSSPFLKLALWQTNVAFQQT